MARDCSEEEREVSVGRGGMKGGLRLSPLFRIFAAKAVWCCFLNSSIRESSTWRGEGENEPRLLIQH